MASDPGGSRSHFNCGSSPMSSHPGMLDILVADPRFLKRGFSLTKTPAQFELKTKKKVINLHTPFSAIRDSWSDCSIRVLKLPGLISIPKGGFRGNFETFLDPPLNLHALWSVLYSCPFPSLLTTVPMTNFTWGKRNFHWNVFSCFVELENHESMKVVMDNAVKFFLLTWWTQQPAKLFTHELLSYTCSILECGLW